MLRMIVTNGSVKNGKSALIYYSDTTDTNYSETLETMQKLTSCLFLKEDANK